MSNVDDETKAKDLAEREKKVAAREAELAARDKADAVKAEAAAAEAAIPSWTIHTPQQNFQGSCLGVRFVDGKGTTRDRGIARRLVNEFGYWSNPRFEDIVMTVGAYTGKVQPPLEELDKHRFILEKVAVA